MLNCTEHLENLQNWTLDQRIKTLLEDTGDLCVTCVIFEFYDLLVIKQTGDLYMCVL